MTRERRIYGRSFCEQVSEFGHVDVGRGYVHGLGFVFFFFSNSVSFFQISNLGTVGIFNR